MRQEDTISAISTPPGSGGIGIVRMSGEEAIAIAGAMFRAKNGKKAEDLNAASVTYGDLVDGNGEIIDEALMLMMKMPHSYTKEDVVEFQCKHALITTICQCGCFKGFCGCYLCTTTKH